jgi:hypothetical protein
MHLKLAECYNSNSINSDEIDRCCQRQIAPADAANHLLDNEINRMQDRIQRCAAVCNDEVRDKFHNAADLNPQAEVMLQKCFVACGEKHLALMKSVKVSIDKQLDVINSTF